MAGSTAIPVEIPLTSWRGRPSIIMFNAVAAFRIILKVISIFVSLHVDEATLKVSDDAVRRNHYT